MRVRISPGLPNITYSILYKKLMCYEYSSQPTEIYGSSAHYLPGKYEQYLPDVEDVIKESLNLIGDSI